MPGRVQGRFVGRTEELGWLQRQLGESTSGQGGPVLLAGEAGVGKTRLLREFVAGVASEVTLLWGNCLDLRTPDIPLLPVMGWLQDATAVLGTEKVAIAAGPFAPELARLDPGLGEPELGSSDPFRLLAGCRYLLRRLSQDRPLAVVIEDVHWADAATLQLLQFLAVELRQSPVLLIATLRTDEPGTQPGGANTVAGVPGLIRLDLARLERDTAERLAAELLDQQCGDSTGADEVAMRSAGNPFYLEELAAANAGGPSETLQGLLMARVRALEPEVAELVELAAVGDPPVDFELWRRAAQLDAGQLDEAFTRARTGAVLTADASGRVAFRHALVRDAVLAALTPGRAIELHRRWAHALEPSVGSSAEASLAAARHWHAVGDRERVLSSSLRAADAARSLHAHGLRAELLDRALQVLDVTGEQAIRQRVPVLREAARAHMTNGEYETAHTRIVEAQSLVDGEENVGMVSEILCDLGELEMYGFHVDPRPRYREALRVLGDTGCPGPRARALAAFVDYALMASVPHQVLAEADQAVSLAQEAGDLAKVALALRGRAMAQAFTDPEASLQDHRASIAAALESGASYALIAAASSLLAVLGIRLGRDQQAFDEGTNYIRLVERMGLRGHPVSAYIHECVGEALVNLGRFEEAERHFREVLSQQTIQGMGRRAQAYLTQIAVITGRDGLARTRFTELISNSHDGPGSALPMWLIPVHRQEASLAWADRGPVAAWKVLAPWIRNGVANRGGMSLFQDVDLVFGGLRAAAHAGLLDSPASPEVALFDEVRNLARAQMDNMPQPHVLDAYLAPVGGEGSAGHWRKAVDVFCRIDGPAYWRVDARTRLAETTTNRAEALDALNRAHAEAARIGSQAQLHDIRAVRDRVVSAPLPGGLTHQELDVIELMAQGLSSQQIAERLQLSRSTARSRESDIMSKLSADERAGALAWARENGLIAQADVPAADPATGIDQRCDGLSASDAELLSRAVTSLRQSSTSSGHPGTHAAPTQRVDDSGSVTIPAGKPDPAQKAVVGWASLTRAERRVAELVSEGLTNRQIAARLHVSPRTVETHVSNSLRKLSARSRVELATAAVAALRRHVD